MFVLPQRHSTRKQNADSQTGRFPLAFQCLPALVLMGGIWFLQESPRWLMERDRPDEALAALKKLHGDGTNDEYIELEFREIRDVIAADRATNEITWFSIFKKPSWRRRLLLGCGVQAFGPLSGINVINYYGPAIYKQLGIGTQESLMIIGISGALSIVYCTIGLWAVDRIGRVKPLIVSAAGCALALVANAAMSQHMSGAGQNQLRAMVAMNFVFSLFYTPTGAFPLPSFTSYPTNAEIHRYHLVDLPCRDLPRRYPRKR